jgi:hypothetical protein
MYKESGAVVQTAPFLFESSPLDLQDWSISMQKSVKVQDKYYLKSVHEDIDLLDRKLAHLEKYDVFESGAARETAASKMNATRELLARTARRLAQEGIPFHESELPRSFRAVSTAPGLDSPQASR